MYKKISLIFGSKTKADEILLLFNDIKEVVRQAFYKNEFIQIEKFCKDNNIFCVKSKFKVLFIDKNSIYSNKGLRIPENDKCEGVHFYYFSKNEEKAYLANYYELVDNQKELGLLLGYPKCCVNYFVNNFSEINSNPEHDVNSGHKLINLIQRGNDAVLISHFPCGGQCQESIKIAGKNLKFLQGNFSNRANELTNVLNLP